MTNSNTSTRAADQASAEFHLVTFDLCGPAESDSMSPTAAAPLAVPCGVSFLVLKDAPQLFLQSPPEYRTHRAPRLEPLFSRPAEPRLLLDTGSSPGASINGVPAPRLTLLTDGDWFHFEAGPVFGVALFYRPRLGPAPTEVIGVACPVCTLALAEGDRCLVCPCGTPLHAAEDEPRDGALCCTKLVTHCPHCQQPVRLVPGYGELSQPGHD
jgi:hypothetical protein